MNAKVLAFPTEYAELNAQVVSFTQFLIDKGLLSSVPGYKIVFARPSERDYTMDVFENKKEIVFNSHLLQTKAASLNYYITIVLHELVHCFVHKIPNKSDAKRVKSSFANVTMRQFDVEADVLVSWYLKERQGWTLIGYLKSVLEGTKVFGDPEVESSKVERFIGTLLSTAKLFMDPGTQQKTYKPTYFLPCLCNRFNDNVPILVQAKGVHSIMYHEMSDDDIRKLREIYTNTASARLTDYGCLDEMIKFIAKTLGESVPVSVQRDLQRLKQ